MICIVVATVKKISTIFNTARKVSTVIVIIARNQTSECLENLQNDQKLCWPLNKLPQTRLLAKLP